MKISFLTALIILIFIIACGSERSNSDEENQTSPELTEEQKTFYLRTGNEISTSVFASLSSELMKAMGEKGVSGALEYCNVRAYPVTDSVASHYQADVMRVAEKYRNPDNRLKTELDKKVFDQFNQLSQEELKESERVYKLGNESVLFYKPILLQPQCMVCHGSESTIGIENLSIIRELYPDDRAVNFSPGDLRGMWKIQMSLREEM